MKAELIQGSDVTHHVEFNLGEWNIIRMAAVARRATQGANYNYDVLDVWLLDREPELPAGKGAKRSKNLQPKYTIATNPDSAQGIVDLLNQYKDGTDAEIETIHDDLIRRSRRWFGHTAGQLAVTLGLEIAIASPFGESENLESLNQMLSNSNETEA